MSTKHHIYQLFTIVNNIEYMYVGKTRQKQPSKRFYDHMNELRNGKKPSSWNGLNDKCDWKFEVIDSIDCDAVTARKMEDKYRIEKKANLNQNACFRNYSSHLKKSILTQYNCGCGGKFTGKNRLKHAKTLKHRAWQEQQNSSP